MTYNGRHWWSNSGPLSFALTRKILTQFRLLGFCVILYLKRTSAVKEKSVVVVVVLIPPV